jgi:hypothetical protein
MTSRCLKLLIGLITVIFIEIIGCTVISQEAVPLEVEGVRGVWFPEGMANRVLSEVEALDDCRSLSIELEELVSVKEDKIEKLTLALEYSEEAENAAVNSLEVVLSERDAEREKAEKWYRRPVVLIVVGVIVGIAGTVGAAKLASIDSK